MNYLKIGLPVGATLIYQDATRTCTVVDGRHVNYNGEERFNSLDWMPSTIGPLGNRDRAQSSFDAFTDEARQKLVSNPVSKSDFF